MKKPISYSKLESTLNKLESQVNAAETHGILTGILSLAHDKAEPNNWHAALLENLDCVKPGKRDWNTINAVADDIVSSLDGEDCAFNLLLPDDDMHLEDRIFALACWCRGYLSGLGLIGITTADLKNEIVKELIGDLSQIAHASVETDASEEDENHFVELVEFVRIAIQNIQVELRGVNQKGILH